MRLLDYSLLEVLLKKAGMDTLANVLPDLVDKGLSIKRYGDIPRWKSALNDLPEFEVIEKILDKHAVSVNTVSDNITRKEQLITALKGLHPWRKGPYSIADVVIDTEWRSDLKWDRLSHHIESLEGKRVLDVGCGNGYHCWRMAGNGAGLVVGVDPTPLFIMQYWALQKYLQNSKVWVVPARMEDLPSNMQSFDTVFSMGVLYHRRSPFDHLQELQNALVAGGELVLETLVIEGNEGEVLVPEGRYSKMGNVWFIPSPATLCSWLRKLKFKDVCVVDISTTQCNEQRSTEWMHFQSLKDFLDQSDLTKTVEGYPAPKRAIITAKA